MLRAGDLCLVVDHLNIAPPQRVFLGKVVTLTVRRDPGEPLRSLHGFYWETVEYGNQPCFAEVVLKKLEPPSDDEYEKFRNSLDLGVKEDDVVTAD